MLSTRNSLFSLANAFTLAAVGSIAQAATLNVPAQYKTLQLAINAAHVGDTIDVAAGTYPVSTITWSGKDLTISGAGEGESIIQGNGTNSCLQTQNLTSASLIYGFTFTGGAGNGGIGGGMYNVNSSLTVSGCQFSSNNAYKGGGMYNYEGAPTISDCSFSSNHASTNGAGLYNDNSAGIVQDCFFTGNYAVSSGGGIANNCNLTVTTSTFQQNVAVQGAGGGIASLGGNTLACNCLFYQNQAGYGGGIYFSALGNAINCTIVGNTANASPAAGSGQAGGVYSGGTPTTMPTLTNCIVWGNTAVVNQCIAGYMNVSRSDTQDWGNSLPFVNGSFSQDPLFVNAAAGNFNLQAGSLCRDRGVNTVLTSPPFMSEYGKLIDLNVCRRLSGSSVDLGAYEYQSVTDVTSQYQVVTLSTTHNANGSITVMLLPLEIQPLPLLDGPDSIVVNGITGYTLTNRTGYTSALTPAGRPYITLPAPGFPMILNFTKTATGTFAPTYQMYDGIGNR